MKRTLSILIMLSSLFIGCKKTTQVTIPVLLTASVTTVTFNTAISGGDVISDGQAEVTARGVCWSTSSNPTIVNSKTSDGAGTGVFVSNLTGLTMGTTYYVRSYATNSLGTSYGDQLTFSTNSLQTPVLSTTTVTGITTTSAITGGNVTGDNGSAVTARGVCWDIVTSPTITGNHTSDGTGTGSFVSSLVGLSPGTTYYVRAYATNNIGTAYGNEISFAAASLLTATLSTDLATSVTTTTSITGGNIASDNGSAVTARGVCYGTTTGPTIAGTHTSDGSGIGAFVSSLAGLTDGTTYYVRAYATNNTGTAYGNEISFTTVAIVATNEVIIQSMAFIPATLTVPVGTTVRWKNKDTMAHTVTSDTGAWDSGNIDINAVFNFPFTAAGTYHYHCTYHPSMTGTIIVQ